MNVSTISFWIQLAFVVVVVAAIAVWIIRFLLMKARADNYMKELGLEIEIEKKDGGFEVIVKPDEKKE